MIFCLNYEFKGTQGHFLKRPQGICVICIKEFLRAWHFSTMQFAFCMCACFMPLIMIIEYDGTTGHRVSPILFSFIALFIAMTMDAESCNMIMFDS